MGIVRGRQKKKIYQYLYLRKLNRFFRRYIFKLFLITLLVKNKLYVQFIKMSLGIPEMSLAALLEHTFTTTEYFLLSLFMKNDCDS